MDLYGYLFAIVLKLTQWFIDVYGFPQFRKIDKRIIVNLEQVLGRLALLKVAWFLGIN